MANWSNDSYWFGILVDRIRVDQQFARLAERNGTTTDKLPPRMTDLSMHDYQGELQRMLENLAWEPTNGHGWPFRVHGVGPFGPALCISGDGRYGADLPLAQSTWNFFNKHVVVWSGHNGFEDYFHHRITIAGEVVYERTFHMFEENGEDTTWKYEGRTPEERHFFELLFAILNKRERSRVEILADALAGNSPEEAEGLA